MAELLGLHPPEKLATTVTDDIIDMHELVSIISSEPRSFDQIKVNLYDAVNSANTYPLGSRDSRGIIRATATLSIARTLRGPEPWIDDVGVIKAFQGNGHSKPLMSRAEEIAARVADHVSLTSNAARSLARAGYEKRGYEVFEGVLHRKSKLEDTVGGQEMPDGVSVVSDHEVEGSLSYGDVEILANVLGQDLEATIQNTQEVLASETTALIVRRHLGQLVGAATVNLCPIPTGYKPWLELAAPTGETASALARGAEIWTASLYDALNTTFVPSDGMEGYVKRDSGLFVLNLNGA